MFWDFSWKHFYWSKIVNEKICWFVKSWTQIIKIMKYINKSNFFFYLGRQSTYQDFDLVPFHFNLPVCKHFQKARGCPRGVMVKAMDCGIVVSEFIHEHTTHMHTRMYTHIYTHWPIGWVRRWSGRPGFNLRSNHTEDSKMVLLMVLSLLNAQHYKVLIKGKVEQIKVME